MGRLFNRAWTWRLIVLLMVAGGSIAVFLYWTKMWEHREIIGVVVTSSIALWQWMMGRSPGFYAFMAKGKALLTNGRVGYSLAAGFDGADITPGKFQEVCDQLYKVGERRETLASADDRLVIRVDGIDLVLKFRWSDGEVDELGHISCEVLEYHGPYDPASSDLQTKILPLVKYIEDTLPGAEREYTLTVQFQGENPFLGVYAKHIRAENLRNFRCEIFEPNSLQGAPSERSITVYKHQMDLCARDIHGLVHLLSKHLALSGGW